jgi:hypothetical protein
MGILIIKVADGLIVRVIYISLILFFNLHKFIIIMKFYEVITNAYANEVSTQNDLPD